ESGDVGGGGRYTQVMDGPPKEEEGEYEDPEEMIREFGRHPLMDRVQEALYNQLLQTYERVSEELREKESGVKKLKSSREHVGVELYSMQQQLAKLQVALEQTHANFNELGENRAKADLDVDTAKQRYQDLKAAKDELSKRLVKNEVELNALQETLRQVELYNEEMKDEILVTRRATYKAEEAVSGLEKSKGQQDLYIDRLMDEVKRLQGQVAVTEAQITTSEGQTGEVNDMLRETSHEMELISFEKKQLLQQWRSALVGLNLRDEALTAANNALLEAENSSRDYDIEIEGLKREILKAQADNEGLVSVRDRLRHDKAFVPKCLKTAQPPPRQMERDQLSERYTMLQRSLTQTEEDEKSLDGRGNQLRGQVVTLTSNLQLVTRERQKLEKEAGRWKSQQTTMSKAVRNLVKKTQTVVEKIHQTEIEEANLQNEQARIHVDTLNTEAHNAQLRETLKSVEEELNAKDQLVGKYQLEIRQRNDEIEKKMYRVDRLNRQYEKLKESVEEPEHTGPLEASVKNLQKERSGLSEENARLKHEWLADQTQLVSTAVETEQHLEKARESINTELRAAASILGQRKARLLRGIASDEAESKRLRSTIQGLHMDMGRINELIGKSGKRVSELGNATSVLEREFIQELRELESQSVDLESRIRKIKGMKADTLDEILEMERQVMLWEKKIQLERETQAALDPGLGKNEVQIMEREIHRMRIRLDGLRREQERMMQAMEWAIDKREKIAVRYKGKDEALAGRNIRGSRGGGGSKDLTATGLKKKVVSIQQQLKSLSVETARYSAVVEDRRRKGLEVSTGLEQETGRFEEAERLCDELQGDINTRLYEKQRLSEVTATKQRLCQKINLKPLPLSHRLLQVEQALLNAEIRLKAVRDVIEGVKGELPHLDDVLTRVARLSEDVTE
ncbi:unnamed protein product, partial [Choristocarpus tenellus]